MLRLIMRVLIDFLYYISYYIIKFEKKKISKKIVIN